LRFAGKNFVIVFTGFKIVVEFTSININGEFWFPCFKILIKFPDVNINARFACNNSNGIIGFEVLSNNDRGTVRKRSSDEENVDLHDYDLVVISKDRPLD
jgi:hypothetical protein